MGNKQQERIKYLDSKILFLCSVIVTNEARTCGLVVKGQDGEPGHLEALPQYIGQVIKPLPALFSLLIRCS